MPYDQRARQYSVRILRGAVDPYVATSPEFTGVVGVGNTPEEALAELYIGLESMLEHLEERGMPIPTPAPAMVD